MQKGLYFLLHMVLSMWNIITIGQVPWATLTVVQSHVLQFLINKALILLSDRQKGLIEGVEFIFDSYPHGYYLYYLEQNIHKQFKNLQLKTFLWKAAQATTQAEFNKAIENIHTINPQALSWLFQYAKLEYWAELYFKGHWFSHLTSNIAVAFKF